MSQAVEITCDSRGVARLTLARPEKHNALSGQMIGELTEAAHRLGADQAVRVVVLDARGQNFCAGGDLGWMQDQMKSDAAGRAAEATRLAMMFQALNEMPKPLIGRIHGKALGGGVGLACVCDVAVAETDSAFGLTETRLGLIPATIGPYVLARMGEAMARRVFMSARIFGSEEAVRLGILAQAVPLAGLDGAIEAEVLPYLSCAPGAVAEAKALARALGPRIDSGVIAASISALVTRWESDEAAHGLESFFAKAKPRWQS